MSSETTYRCPSSGVPSWTGPELTWNYRLWFGSFVTSRLHSAEAFYQSLFISVFTSHRTLPNKSKKIVQLRWHIFWRRCATPSQSSNGKGVLKGSTITAYSNQKSVSLYLSFPLRKRKAKLRFLEEAQLPLNQSHRRWLITIEL